MKVAIVTLSDEGARVAGRIRAGLRGAKVYAHAGVGKQFRAVRFRRVAALTRRLFRRVAGLVYVLPCGVAARAVAPLAGNKRTDPAVVVTDVGARYVVSLLGGHEAGANALALAVANLLGAEPVVTTSSEARKTAIVGVGCRRGVPAARIEEAVRATLRRAGVALEDVRLLASADIKRKERGLRTAARRLGLPLRFIASEEIRTSGRRFARSQRVQKNVGLPAVAEPAALLAGRRTRLTLKRQVFEGVTTAVARESFTWSGSGPAAR